MKRQAALAFYLINTPLPEVGACSACISSRITTVIHVVRYHQINYNWFNEPFAVSQYKLFILRHAWLNLWDKHMTTGRINQVATMPMKTYLISSLRTDQHAQEFVNRSKFIGRVRTWAILHVVAYSVQSPALSCQEICPTCFRWAWSLFKRMDRETAIYNENYQQPATFCENKPDHGGSSSGFVQLVWPTASNLHPSHITSLSIREDLTRTTANITESWLKLRHNPIQASVTCMAGPIHDSAPGSSGHLKAMRKDLLKSHWETFQPSPS